MIRNPILLKALAVLLTLEMLVSILAPTLSMALTSGPTAPEASSFEPVDTSEMVDLTTGDMVYNLPLLEVPGPAGSYPVSIAYHAAINPASDASWVGLGWNINSGSILRSTSGYPDDWKDVNSQNSESWSGGVTHRVSKGISLSYWGFTVSAGVIKTNDTYKGSGNGSYSSFGFGKAGAFIGFGVSNDPVYGSSLSIGGGYSRSGIGTSSANVSIKLGVNSVFTAGGGSSSSSLSLSKGLLGASISSNGTISASVAGIGLNSGHLNNSGRVQTESNSNLSWGQNAAIHYGTGSLFDYSDDYIKYSINEYQNTVVNGALYASPSEMTESYFDRHDYDVYDMVEVADRSEDPSKVKYPKFGVGNEIMMGGTLPAPDNYMVMGQGTGGSIKPYDMLSTLYRQNKKNKYDKYITKQYRGAIGEIPLNAGRSEFMFSNEFSNSFLYDNAGNEEYFGQGTSLAMAFKPEKVSTDPNLGDKTINNKLGRASNVEWFANKDISPTGLLSPNAKGFIRNTEGTQGAQVGALRVTNPSGVTYHYALPVYTYNEEYYTENIAHDKEGAFRTIVKRSEPYAYAWYLTAVTGPDYVDRNNDGLTQDDWGYWVEFEYGKWTSDYKWRTPETGFVEDLDGNFRNYSRGKKELYYLNAIRTATHTALFIKDIRRDGKGLAESGSEKNGKEASFVPSPCNQYPTSVLKLTKIILVENSHLPAIDYSYNNSQKIICTREVSNDGLDPDQYPGPSHIEQYDAGVHLEENVLLSENIKEQMAMLEEYSIKRIAFDTDDTQMMPNTPNSFSNEGLYTTTPVASTEKFGRLELKAITVFGRGSKSLIPPIKFDYKNKTTPYDKDKTDYWGFYKSDYNAAIKDVNLRKMTTEESAQQVDTWSLNKIVTSVGAEIQIDYESDDYEKSVLHNNVNFKVADMTTEGDGQYKVFIDDLSGELQKHFTKGDYINSLLVVSEAKKHTIKFSWLIPLGPKPDGCSRVTYFKLDNVTPYYNRAIIKDIKEDHLIIEVDANEEKLLSIPYHTNPDFSKSQLDDIPNEVKIIAPGCTPQHSLLLPCIPMEAKTEHFRDFIGGEIIAPIIEDKKGGGLRVKEIKLIEPQSGLIHSTTYDYKNPVTGKSSGVTTYVPFKTNQFTLNYPEAYEKAVEGYFINGEVRNGGTLVNIIKNWKEISRTIIFGPAMEHLLDYFDLIGHPDRKTMAAFMGLALNTRNDVAEYKRAQLMRDLLSKVNEVPSANVMYEYVTVRNKVILNGEENNNQSYVVNQFIVYDESMVNIETSHQKSTNLNPNPKNRPVPRNQNSDDPNPKYRNLMKRGVTITNFGNAVGQIKSSKIYALDGTLLNEKTYHYLHELNNTSPNMLENYMTKLASYKSQGVLDETYVTGRYIPYASNFVDEEAPGPGEDAVEEKEVFDHDLVGVMTKRRNLPIIMLSEENKNYKTGITTIAQNLAFDFYSGNVIKNMSTDGYGNTYVSEMIPAYENYPGMHLGIKGGKHMLSQEAASYTYKVDPANSDTKLGLVSASIQTWSDRVLVVEPGKPVGTNKQDGIWRKHASYSFIGDNVVSLSGDGIYPVSNATVPLFSAWNGEPTTALWQKNSEITLFDVNSHALEAADINNHYAATKMTFDHTRVLITGANCEYQELAYSGAEEKPQLDHASLAAFGGNVYCLGTWSQAQAHTGLYSVKANAGSGAYSYTFNAMSGSYVVSFWSSQPSAKVKYQVNSNPFTEATLKKVGQAGAWYLLEATLTGISSNSNLKIWNEASTGITYFDDFRVHPSDAAATSYVYNQWGELSHILDANNLYTKFEYDGMGRLKFTYKETFNHGEVKTSEQRYHYARQ